MNVATFPAPTPSDPLQEIWRWLADQGAIDFADSSGCTVLRSFENWSVEYKPNCRFGQAWRLTVRFGNVGAFIAFDRPDDLAPTITKEFEPAEARKFFAALRRLNRDPN